MGELKIGIYSHQDSFIDLLYDSNRQFEGQLFSPHIVEKSNGEKTFTFQIPLMIFDVRQNKYIENPRWQYITNHYKIRVNNGIKIEEFVMQSYNESRNESDEVTIEVTCNSLAQFELSQIGYGITFNIDSLRQFIDGEDPNDPDSKQIGAYDAIIDFWEEKLLQNTDWDYEIQAYYEPETIGGHIMPIRDEHKLYESGKIKNYNSDNTPQYITEYTEKQRVITAEKSNIWNIQGTICEKFEVWPEFKIEYENGNIISKTIILRNDIPQDSLFTIRYSKNEKSISRDVDGSQLVTKMYVTDLVNENVDSGLVSISENDANYMRENYLLDFDWYLGNIDDEELSKEQLIDPDLTMTFTGEPIAFGAKTYAKTPFQAETITGAENVIQAHKDKIRNRNLYIEDKAIEVSKKQAEYIDLCAEKEFKQASRESALENYNEVLEEWELCPQETQMKIKDRCFVYSIDNNLIVSFSEKGIKDSDILNAVKYNDLNNICYLDGDTKIEITNKNNIAFEIFEREPITGCVTKIRIIGAGALSNTQLVLGDRENYACFSIDLKYNPLYFYNLVKEYWWGIAEAHLARLTALGLTPDEGGVYDEDQQVYDDDGNPTNQLILKCYADLKVLKQDLYDAKKHKENAIHAFESEMAPYLREGYWEDTDYGVYSNNGIFTEGLNSINKPLYNESVNHIVWTDEKVCFKIPNNELIDYYPTEPQNGSFVPGKLNARLGLYDVIDIDSIEVMTGNPANELLDVPYKNYVKGTDFEIGYGFTAKYDVNTDGQLIDSNRQVVDYETDKLIHPEYYGNGIYLIFQNTDAFFRASKWAVTQSTKLFVRAKARGSDMYIFAQEISPEYFNTKRKAYCQMQREIIIQNENIVLSSVKAQIATGQINYKIGNGPAHSSGPLNPFVPEIKSAQPIIYDLIYGKDFYVYKDTNELDQTIMKIRFNETTNSPLLTGARGVIHAPAWYNITYDQDITAKFYYNDAVDNMEDFKKPRVSYNINVLDLTQAIHTDRDYSSYYPRVGTRVPIYDKELHFNGLLGFIDIVDFNLFEPQNTQITISSYKDKFEDLFQKITQATVAMQSKEYAYDAITNVIDIQNGAPAIKIDILKQSLLDANEALSMSQNNDVVWDSTGITLTNKVTDGIPGQVKLTSGGIFVSDSVDENGNYQWTSAITPGYINASLMRAGHLDTRSIAIWNESEPTFLWNSDGIYAYNNKNGLTDYNSFVVFNKDGLKFRDYVDYDANLVVNQLFTNTTGLSMWSAKDNNNRIINVQYNNMVSTIHSANADSTYGPSRQLIIYRTVSSIGNSHRYYYKVNIHPVDLPLLSSLTAYVGFEGNLREVSYAELEENNWQVSGIIETDSQLIDRQFEIITALSQEDDQWAVNISDEILIDLTSDFNDPNIIVPELDILDRLHRNNFVNDKCTIEPTDTPLKVYRDSLRLGWNGLEIFAQNDAVSLTAENGLIISAREGNTLSPRLKMGKYEDAGPLGLQNYYGIIGYDSNNARCFSVDERGVYVSGEIVASSGNIGNFIIANGALYYGKNALNDNHDGVYISSSGIALGALNNDGTHSKFEVHSDGSLWASNANISGNIAATGGSIGGFTIDSTSLYAGTSGTSNYISLSTSNGIKLGKNFSVSKSGALIAKDADITGDITATELYCDYGEIGGFSIDSSSLYAGSGSKYIELSSSDGLIIGNNFSVSQTGDIIAKQSTFYLKEDSEESCRFLGVNSSDRLTGSGLIIKTLSDYEGGPALTPKGQDDLYIGDPDGGFWRSINLLTYRNGIFRW